MTSVKKPMSTARKLKLSWINCRRWRKQNRRSILIFSFVIIAWSASWILIVWLISNREPWAERGQFGDMFGAVNALFSGLAFAGIIITILLQKEELQLQRKELVETRNEFAEQNRTMKQQRFENTFFELLKTMEENNRKLTRKILNIPMSGRELLDHNFEIFKSKRLADVTDPITTGRLKQLYNESIQSDPTLLKYIKNITLVLAYVENTELIPEETKELYFEIINCKLQPRELEFLFYHCCFNNGKDTFTSDSLCHILVNRDFSARIDIDMLIDKITDLVEFQKLASKFEM